MDNILEILTERFSEVYIKKYDNIIFPCPLCKGEGADNHGDNLIYNTRKNLLTCFREPSHSKILRSQFYNALRNHGAQLPSGCDNTYMNNIGMTDEKKLELILKFDEYIKCLYDSYRDNKGIIEHLEDIRGINLETVSAVGLGIRQTNTVYEKNYGYDWCIPTIEYSTDSDNICELIMGYEYRPADFSKDNLRREPNCKTGLAMVNAYDKNTEILVVLEGYFDAYAFLQFLREKNQLDYYHIITPSNGINSLIKQLQVIKPEKYKKCYLMLDNDSAGQEATKNILEEYPFFKDVSLKGDCKDFNEYYLKYVKNKNN